MTDDTDRRRAVRELAAYFALTFAITWGLGAALLLARPALEAVVGPLGRIDHHWIYFLAVSAPTISAVALSLALGGLRELRRLAARFVRPVSPLWIVAAILIWPLALAAWEGLAQIAGGGGQVDLHALALTAPVLALTTPVLIVDPGGFGEEAGWRGFALPRLLRLMPPAAAGLLLGVIWGVWHLPAFFVSDLAQSHFGFGWFLLAITGASVLMTWIYVNSGGNVLVAGVVPHLVFNLLFDAKVFPADAIRTEGMVMGLLAAGLCLCLGPTLAGWRSATSPREQPS